MVEHYNPAERLAELALAERAAREKDSGVDQRSFFTITVHSRGYGCNWEGTQAFSVVERAHSLKDAVTQASKRPFRDWCETMIKIERDKDHDRAIAKGEHG